MNSSRIIPHDPDRYDGLVGEFEIVILPLSVSIIQIFRSVVANQRGGLQAIYKTSPVGVVLPISSVSNWRHAERKYEQPRFPFSKILTDYVDRASDAGSPIASNAICACE